MGSPIDEPERCTSEIQHRVVLTKGFWLADTACTQALWKAVMGENPSFFTGNDLLPVETVSWDDAQLFIRELNQIFPGLHARLPTEAEWEYACRAGTTTPFSFGDNLTPELVNYDGSAPYFGGRKKISLDRTVPVGSLPPNAWGFYEMHGNVWEWCADWYGPYRTDEQIDPLGPQAGDDRVFRVLRGGSWVLGGEDVRSACRGRANPAYHSGTIGFRIAADGERL